MDCIEAIQVYGDCNDLDKRPPLSEAEIARQKAGIGVSKIKLDLSRMSPG